jgi:hypothetical protein
VERGERIYDSGIAEEAYRPDPGSRVALAEAATLVGGRVVEESAVDAVGPAVRGIIGSGVMRDRRHEGGRFALMPYITLAAFLPLGFVLFRRNL